MDSAVGAATVPLHEGLQMLHKMYEVRFFEEQVQQMFLENLVRGSTHLAQGQEAVSVGACSALRSGDTMTCTYRGHAAVLAMGADLDRAFGEILGKTNGLCGGKGGSMHLTDISVGALGSFAIVGAHLPITLGSAWAGQYREDGTVSLCFFGDGAANIGAFHESLNLAAIWSLPVIFVCENNLYGEYSPLRATTPIEKLADRAASYGMPGIRVDGNRVTEVRTAVERAAARARDGEGPTLIEAVTYRHKGHSRSDPATYRPKGELERWLRHDPIHLYRAELQAAGCSTHDLQEAERDAQRIVDEAATRAKTWPEPEPESRLRSVWA